MNEPLLPQAGIWYFAHSYSAFDVSGLPSAAGMEANFRLCCLRAARLIDEGWLIYAPVAHTHAIKMAWPAFATESEERWYEFDLLTVDQVPFAGIILPPLWRSSNGCLLEKERFEQMRRRVLYFCDPCHVYTEAA